VRGAVPADGRASSSRGRQGPKSKRAPADRDPPVDQPTPVKAETAFNGALAPPHEALMPHRGFNPYLVCQKSLVPALIIPQCTYIFCPYAAIGVAPYSPPWAFPP